MCVCVCGVFAFQFYTTVNNNELLNGKKRGDIETKLLYIVNFSSVSAEIYIFPPAVDLSAMKW